MPSSFFRPKQNPITRQCQPKQTNVKVWKAFLCVINQIRIVMTKEIFLSGMTADQLSEMIRESLRDELQQLHPEPSAETPNYLTRRETARRLRISLVTLSDWVNRGRIRAHKDLNESLRSSAKVSRTPRRRGRKL